MKIGTMMEKTTICEELPDKMMEQEWNNYNHAWKGRHIRFWVNRYNFLLKTIRLQINI